MLKCVAEWQGTIPASHLEDSQLGVIVEWGKNGSLNEYRGRIVQLIGETLQCIGMPEDECWNPDNLSNGCRVRVLEPGEKLEVC